MSWAVMSTWYRETRDGGGIGEFFHPAVQV